MNLLDEGVRRRLLLNDGQLFQFAHQGVRDVFYKEPPSDLRRQQIHFQIAQKLEQLNREDLDRNLPEIAYHIIRAGSFASPSKLIDYAKGAATYAFSHFAWGEAARYYEVILSTAQQTNLLSGQERADFHYLAGLSYYRDMDAGPSRDHYDKAIEGYRLLGDSRGLARALIEKVRAQRTFDSVPYGALADLQSLEEVLHTLDDSDSALRGRIWAQMTQIYWHARQTDKAEQIGQKALEVGESEKDDLLYAEAHFGLGLVFIQNCRVSQALASWQKAHDIAVQMKDPLIQGWALARMAWASSCLGHLKDAETYAQEAAEVTSTAHEWSNNALALSMLATMAGIKGNFEVAEEYAREAMEMVQRSRYPWAGLSALLALAGAKYCRGAWTEAEEAVTELITPGRIFADPGPAFHIIGGVPQRLLQAHAAIQGGKPLEYDVGLVREEDTDIFFLAGFCALVEIAQLTDTPVGGLAVYHRLMEATKHGVVFSSAWGFLLHRILGVIDTLNGKWEEAEDHFRMGLKYATESGAQPELGRTYLDYARMLVAQDSDKNRDRVQDFASQASAIFKSLGMTPFEAIAQQVLRDLVSHTSERIPARVEDVIQFHVPQAQEVLPNMIGHAVSGPSGIDDQTFRLVGQFWTISYGGEVSQIKDSKGIRCISYLLRYPHKPIRALWLDAWADKSSAGHGELPLAYSENIASEAGLNVQESIGHAGEILDQQAKSEYKNRLKELYSEIEEARGFNDRGRVSLLQLEIEALEDELGAGFGLGGRPRVANSSEEQARINITRAIRRALKLLSKHHAGLGTHLTESINTGTACSYTPESNFPSPWRF